MWQMSSSSVLLSPVCERFWLFSSSSELPTASSYLQISWLRVAHGMWLPCFFIWPLPRRPPTPQAARMNRGGTGWHWTGCVKGTADTSLCLLCWAAGTLGYLLGVYIIKASIYWMTSHQRVSFPSFAQRLTNAVHVCVTISIFTGRMYIRKRVRNEHSSKNKKMSCWCCAATNKQTYVFHHCSPLLVRQT